MDIRGPGSYVFKEVTRYPEGDDSWKRSGTKNKFKKSLSTRRIGQEGQKTNGFNASVTPDKLHTNKHRVEVKVV